MHAKTYVFGIIVGGGGGEAGAGEEATTCGVAVDRSHSSSGSSVGLYWSAGVGIGIGGSSKATDSESSLKVSGRGTSSELSSLFEVVRGGCSLLVGRSWMVAVACADDAMLVL